MVYDIVHKHSGVNDPDDSLPHQVMRDADRLAIMSIENIGRHGQFTGDDLPSIDLVHLDSDPHATYREQRTMFRASVFWEEWADFDNERVGIKTEKAKPLALRRAAQLRAYRNAVISDLKESGVIQ